MSAGQARSEVRPVSFVSGAHRIDARLQEPIGRARGAAVVAHPHPAHGGDMDHPVVRAAAHSAAVFGLRALRFDFRGVGRSEGHREDAEGHLEDWRVALAEARRRTPDGPLLGAGFSYGARGLATLLAREPPPPVAPDALLLLAPATRVPRTRRDFGNLLLGRPLSDAAVDPAVLANLHALVLPTEVIVGEEDVVAPAAELAAHLPSHAHLQVLPGLNHFFSRGRGSSPFERDVFLPALAEALQRLVGL